MPPLDCKWSMAPRLQLRYWLPKDDMLPQSHCADEEDGRIGLSS